MSPAKKPAKKAAKRTTKKAAPKTTAVETTSTNGGATFPATLETKAKRRGSYFPPT